MNKRSDFIAPRRGDSQKERCDRPRLQDLRQVILVRERDNTETQVLSGSDNCYDNNQAGYCVDSNGVSGRRGFFCKSGNFSNLPGQERQQTDSGLL